MRVSPILRVFLAAIVALTGLSLIASTFAYAQPAVAPLAQTTPATTAVATTVTGTTAATATPVATLRPAATTATTSGATAASTPAALPTTGSTPSGDSSFLVLIGVLLLLSGAALAIYRPASARR